MALELKISKSSITSNCATLTIADTTGNYSATNTSGYGAPNEARANLYNKLFVTLKKSTGDVVIAIDAYDENTASSWTVDISEDGWYELYLFGCLAWGSGITYETDYITYDAATDTYYKSLQDSNTNNAVTDPAWWEAVDEVADFKAAIALDQPDTYAGFDDFVEKCNSTVCRARAWAQDSAKERSTNSCCNGAYNEIDYQLAGAEINEAAEAFSKAQVNIETIQSLCGCIDNDNS